MEPNPLTPDVAAKVLRADLHNTVAKVAAGGKLAGTDRQRFEAATVPAAPTASDLATLKLNRQAALIRRWASGGKLTPDEMAEVHPILPAEVLATTPAAICPHVRTRYQKTFEDYAEQLGVGLRTVKRWAALGRQAGEQPPFDDLAAFPAWYAKHMPYAIKASVLAICTGAKRPGSGSATGSATTGAEVLDEKPGGEKTSDSTPGGRTDASSNRAAINVHDLAAIGLKENVERLSKIHRANLELLEHAFGGSSDTELQLRQRNAEKSARMLSDAQRNYDSYQKEHGELVELSEVKRELLRVHSAMAQSLVGLFVAHGIHRDRAITAVDTWTKHLRETRFAAGTTPELRPPSAAAA